MLERNSSLSDPLKTFNLLTNPHPDEVSPVNLLKHRHVKHGLLFKVWVKNGAQLAGNRRDLSRVSIMLWMIVP